MPPMQTASQSTHRKACKECRRLRLGCDREVPCYNCKRRGCSAICPDGTLEKGARSRSTIIVELQETIAELRNRNYLLEEALKELQTSVSTEQHPLLRDKKLGKTDQVSQHLQSLQAGEDGDEEVLDALGTFSINDTGDISLHGPTAAMEYFIKEGPALPGLEPEERADSPMSLPADFILLSALFPFPPNAVPLEKIEHFIPHLPPFKTAVHLVELYFTHFAWCSNPITKSFFMSNILAECYPAEEPAASLVRTHSHIASTLFMVCGLGMVADFQNKRRFVEAEEYHTLARAALCICPVYEYPTVYAAQSMAVMLLYHMCTEKRSNAYVLALWGVMGRLCEALGLNYDQSKLKKGCTELREQLFWESSNLDSWQAFVSGRPKSISSKVISCRKPPDPETAPGGGWITWKHIFTPALDRVVERAFRAEKGATYSQIQQLEQEIQTIPTPSAISWPKDEEKTTLLGGPRQQVTAMERYLANGSIETAFLHINLWFFRQAIRESPANPFDHPFAYSVRRVIESSIKLLDMLRDIYTYQPINTAVFRPAWTYSYSAAMALGTLILVCPKSADAERALAMLDVACELFIVTQENRRELKARKSLHTLLRLREDAHKARAELRPFISQVETIGFWSGIMNPYNQTPSPTS
ncbi:hypothetical protein M422DRAFT_780572 [Sphaerobolus stellatus SS14]|uniref:Zn(2)-C6 fungal-type domain-containing protein n=1 Tax=Sphaerobolus stellatus (strain SS14) TaxID=990650 RepID=A0A0C9V1M5_SPHS4|nr:hypothetical protein M422DRAFT_780572 [Sphaerobolus stellatus SS14]